MPARDKMLTKLRDKLLCGFKPEALDPSIILAIDNAAKLMEALQKKGPKAIEGMSVADLAKAVLNLQKALDGLARLRSFAAGGPDQRPEAPQFIMKVIAPDRARE